ncbi:MAG: DUF3822 family protein [Bacteroidaceae bacterium]|nr:DUF3822 family protein [Bacteroidaceae bacterium]
MNETLNKSLSIRIATNGLSFCSYTPLSSTPFTYKVYDVQPTISLAANLKNALLHEPILKEEYQRVNVLITSPHATFVPVVDFKADNVEDIYAYNFPKDHSMHISYNVLRRTGVAIIFSIDKNIYQLLVDDYPRARFYASASTLIEFFGHKSLDGEGYKLFAYLHEKEITLYAFGMGRMQSVNTFKVTTVEDSMFYILNFSKPLGFRQTDDELYIVGDTGKEQELANKLQNFQKNVMVIDRKADFRSSITNGNALIPYDLQTLLICGF